MLQKNWNWRNNWLFVTFLSLVKFQLGGGRPAWLSLCSNCGKQKRYLQTFREVSGVFQQNFNGSKNSAVLEPRTGQFSRTWGFEAKDLRLRGQGQGLENVSSRTSSRPRTPPLLRSMAKISLYGLPILKKHMTEFLGINFGRFCRSMALMVNCCAPLSHSTADRRFVFG